MLFPEHRPHVWSVFGQEETLKTDNSKEHDRIQPQKYISL